MSKIVLDSIVSGYDLSKINANFQKLQTELNEKVLYRNAPTGEPNSLENDIDVNGKNILNVGSLSVEGYPDLTSIVVEANAAKDQAIAAKDVVIGVEDEFTDIYLGNKSADPLIDNDGNPLIEGCFYFNVALSPKRLRVYNGVGWQDAAASVTNVVNSIDNSLYPSQAEAEWGVNDVKVMSPLRTKQSILVNAATLAQGALAESAIQPDDVGTSAGKIVALDGAGKLPAVDGSQLLGIQAVPPGSLIMHAAASAPAGYLKANGDAVPRSAYSALFSVIGTSYGAGDGSTTFNLPDFRGYFPRAWDDGRGVDSGRTIGSSQSDDIQSHSHLQRAYTAGGGALDGLYRQNGTVAVDVIATGVTGGTETRPKNIAVLFCIKY